MKYLARARTLGSAAWILVVRVTRTLAVLLRTRVVPTAVSIGRAVRARSGPALRSVAVATRTRLGPGIRALAVRIGALTAGGRARFGPAVRSNGARIQGVLARTWARLDSRGRAAVLGGGGLLAVLLVVVLTLGRGGPLPLPLPSGGGPSASPSASQMSVDDANALVARVLPTPSTTDTVLLVSSTANLSPTELRWLSDLRGRLGNVDSLAYRDATLERLRRYFVVFVIDQSPDLDPKALTAAYAAGLSIHLIGPGASYRAQVAGAAP